MMMQTTKERNRCASVGRFRIPVTVLLAVLLLFLVHAEAPCAAPTPATAAAAAAPAIATRGTTPSECIRNLLEQAMAVQTDPALQGPAFRERRRSAIRAIIGANFAFPTMAENALGPQWQKLTAAQRAEFEAIFRDLFQDSYTKLVLDFLQRERIIYGKEETHDGKATVKTILMRPNEEIPIDYTLIRSGTSWLVADVTIDGVSIVGNYRISFARVLKRDSYPGLLKKMRLQQQAIEKDAGKKP